MAICTLPLTSTAETKRLAPICVIGAGIAGLLVALRLARVGRRVIVVESGTDTFNAQINQLNDIEDQFGRYSRAFTGRFREFGGNSAYWGGRLIPLSSHDTGERPYLSLPGWPFPASELEAYGPEIEKIFGVDAFSYEEDLLTRFDRNGLFSRGD